MSQKNNKGEVKRLKPLYTPRKFQKEVHLTLKRFNVLVCHRRFGKTVLTVNEIIDRGLTNPLRNPQYAYVAPTYKQAKQIAWQYFIDFTRHIPAVKANKGDLEIVIPRPWRKDPVTGESDPDHVKFLLIGSDNPDALRGLYLDGAVLDEFAQCDPIIWGQILRPALSDRKKIANDMGIFKDMVGRDLEPWAIFLGTPKGQNHFYRRYMQAIGAMDLVARYESRYDVEYQVVKWEKFESTLNLKEDTPTKVRDEILSKQNKLTVKQYKRYRGYCASKNWYGAIYKASETGVLGQSEIDEMTADLQKEEVEQELECSFTAAILGSYYGETLNQIKDQGNIGDIPYDPSIPVSTFWDIGMKDKTTIWFRQRVGKYWHYIDYEEYEGKGIPELAKEINKKPYNIVRHVWPHDGAAREFGTGVSRQETARKNGLWPVHIQPKQSVQDRINATRIRLRLSKFDKVNCERGLECLFNYQKEYDSKLMMFKSNPKHDWASHGSDSYGYSSLDDTDDEAFNNYNSKDIQANLEYDELEH